MLLGGLVKSVLGGLGLGVGWGWGGSVLASASLYQLLCNSFYLIDALFVIFATDMFCAFNRCYEFYTFNYC